MNITREDIAGAITVIFCGTNKTKHKQTIIHLFKTYVDSSSPICMSCRFEVMAVWKKFQFYFDIHMKKEIILSLQLTKDVNKMIDELGISQKLIDLYVNDSTFKNQFDEIFTEKNAFDEVEKYMKGE